MHILIDLLVSLFGYKLFLPREVMYFMLLEKDHNIKLGVNKSEKYEYKLFTQNDVNKYMTENHKYLAKVYIMNNNFFVCRHNLFTNNIYVKNIEELNVKSAKL